MVFALKDIKAYAFECFAGARGSHGWDHTERVYRLCRHIGRIEGSNMEVLAIAAYLHDVGRPYQDESKGAICHAEKGSEMARSLLIKYPMSDRQKANVIHCIESHRFRGDHKPESLEARVLFDADKLDAIGAIGIGRAFLFAGEVGARLHNATLDPEDTESYSENDTGYREFRVKLSRIKDRMQTHEGLRMAGERHEFMARFFERLLREYEGHE